MMLDLKTMILKVRDTDEIEIINKVYNDGG